MEQKKPRQRKPRVKETTPFIRFAPERSDEKPCPDCRGTGYDPYDGGQCDRCADTGMVPR